MSDVKAPVRPAPTYEGDFYAWTQYQAQTLRELRPNSIDWENIAEEIETLGRSQRSEIRSRLTVALIHLLKWAYQPDKRSNSWKASILGARSEILDELADSPSLKRYPGQVIARQYRLARLEASGDTSLDLELFPETCPFTIEQILDLDFYPDAPAE
jgi:hypothetical protein